MPRKTKPPEKRRCSTCVEVLFRGEFGGTVGDGSQLYGRNRDDIWKYISPPCRCQTKLEMFDV